MNYSEFLNFDRIKDNIIFRIINYDRNRSILEEVPYLRLNDLAITFRWLASMEEAGIATVLIRREHMAYWNITLQMLVRLANRNTPRLFPFRVMPLNEMIADFLKDENSIQTDNIGNSMLVLTNQFGINGAGCICYKGVLEKLASELHSNLYILPSSVHEVIVMPDNAGTDKKQLEFLVRTTNEELVAEDEVLSNQVYYYDKGRKSLTIA